METITFIVERGYVVTEQFIDVVLRGVQDILPPILLGVFGGFIQALHNPKIVKFSRYLIEILTASFVALLMWFLLDDVAFMSSKSKAVAIGISGYLSNRILEMLSKFFLRKLGYILHNSFPEAQKWGPSRKRRKSDERE